MGFETMPTGVTEAPKQESRKVENIDSYEMEKIKNTLSDLQRAARAIEIYLEEMSKLDEQGVKVIRKNKLDKLRVPNGPAGPENDIGKIVGIFQSALVELGKAKKYDLNDPALAEDIKKLYEKK